MKSRLLSAGHRARQAADRVRPSFDRGRRLAARFAATPPVRLLIRLGSPAIPPVLLAWRWRYVAVAAAAVVLISVYSGSVEGTDRALVLMGFDPDRAQLITSLIIGGAAAGAAALVRSRALAASLLGTAGVIALYAQTFAEETDNALKATGPAGAFDAVGWVLTLVTLFVIGAISAWIGTTLAMSVRPGLIATGRSIAALPRWCVTLFRWVRIRALIGVAAAVSAVGRLVRRPSLRTRPAGRAKSALESASPRPDWKTVRRPIAALLIVVLLAVCLPVFGDMVNLSPDALMLNGVPRQPLVPSDPVAVATATIVATAPPPSPSHSATASGSAAIEPTQSAGATPTGSRGHAAPGSKPWLAWKPAGKGNFTVVELPAPWIGGLASVSEVSIYTPAGYSDSGSEQYPVIYEAPTGLALWAKGTGVAQALDTMISSGDIPASIVVFIDSANAPNTDSQCADSYDGSQWFERYISETVPDYVEAHYRAIPDRRARAIMGMSAGGFCAAMLGLRHRDVFGTAISFSGYYYAGTSGPNARRPFGSQADLDAHSPILLAPKVPASERAGLYFVVVANLPQGFYGPAAYQFEQVLKSSGFPLLEVDSMFTHGWTQVRYETPGALKAWAAHMVVAGVW